MSATGQRSVWMVAVIAFLGAIGYVALRPPSQSSPASTPYAPTAVSNVNVPAVPDNPFVPSNPARIVPDGAGDWAMEGLNPARTRAVETPIAPPLDQQRVVAAASFEEGVSPPVIARGLILLETKDTLSAIDLRTGRQRWAYRQKGAYISPAVAGDTVYFRAEQANQGN